MPETPKKKSNADIVVPEKTLSRNRLPRRDITIALSAKKKPDTDALPPAKGATRMSSSTGSRPPRSTSMKKPLIWSAGAFVLAALLFVVAWAMGGVSVNVTPKTASANFSGVVMVWPQETQTGESPPPPPPSTPIYETKVVAKRQEEVVPATERREVEERATGTITISNDYSSAVQRLVKNTRFETPDGRIYRINESVDVPGQQMVNGAKVPGTVDVSVFADELGERYNLESGTFTVPGFKGSPQYTKFSAKTKTAIAGGFTGERLVPDEAAVEAARARLRTAIETELEGAVEREAPVGTIMLAKGELTFESLPLTEASSGVAVIERGSVPVQYVNESVFAAAVASKALPGYDGHAISFVTPWTFEIIPAPPVDSTESTEDMTEGVLRMQVQGTVGFLWHFDRDTLAKDLAGTPSAEMDTIMHDRHPGIDHAEAVFRPFCIRCIFPLDPAEITVSVVRKGEEGLNAEGQL